jgi:hypothetical protein
MRADRFQECAMSLPSNSRRQIWGQRFLRNVFQKTYDKVAAEKISLELSFLRAPALRREDPEMKVCNQPASSCVNDRLVQAFPVEPGTAVRAKHS